MNIHEHQAKGLLNTSEEAIAATETLGSPIWVVKSQIHLGGRGAGQFQDGPQTIRQ